jgi:methyl-accepting chemotaxis protein
MQPAMTEQENASEAARKSESRAASAFAGTSIPDVTTVRVFLGAAGIALASIASSRFGTAVAIGAGLSLATLYAWSFARSSKRRLRTFAAILESIREANPSPLDIPATGDLAEFVAEWNETWPTRCSSIQELSTVADRVRGLPSRLESTFGSIEEATSNQEEAVEETASLVANMKQSMLTIGERVDVLLQSSDSSASSVLEMSSSIDEVASNTATLHEVVEASTSSVHEMGASIRQVAQGAESVQELAESTASSVVQMDRSVQEVSSNALEASSLTERAHAGATAGAEAVRATITDIEQISSLTNEAKDRLGGLVSRISQIGSILAAIDEINDETKLLSLNAAIIAAQAGEQGKAFLVVANHVKTLSQRTAGSTHDIESLIADIEVESSGAVRAMEAGIKAVAKGVERSQDAGSALVSIQEACRDASERVGEIARATAEQSRSSKGVAESTQTTSAQIQQISQAIREQRRASESMLESAERALETCGHVHRSTDEQRRTSRQMAVAISEIADMVRTIGEQTTVHARASESVSESVMHLLENARQSGSSIEPIRNWVAELAQDAESSIRVPDNATASPARCGNSSPSSAGTIESRSA